MVNTKIINVGSPERGDIVVFRYPMDESMDYIKRVVGLPGDTVSYINKKLTINGEPVSYEAVGDWVDPFSMVTLSRSQEPWVRSSTTSPSIRAWVRACAAAPTTVWAMAASTLPKGLCARFPKVSTS